MELEVIPWRGASKPSETEVSDRLAREGFQSFAWQDPPGASYTPHAHPHDESIWLLEGEISFGIAGDQYTLHAGDRLMLPADTVHTALAGPAGATYVIGQRLDQE
jgi:quercetin dioxygenase-like cupin family protein